MIPGDFGCSAGASRSENTPKNTPSVGGPRQNLHMTQQAIEVGDARFVCAHCGADSQQVWADLTIKARVNNGQTYVTFSDAARWRIEGSSIWLSGNDYSQPEWRATVCAVCGEGSVWRDAHRVYPVASTIAPVHPDAPESVAALYEEARSVLPISRRASAALVRATLERLLREIDPNHASKRLDDLIAQLRGQIREPLWKFLTAIRIVGNDTLHAEEGELAVLYLGSEPEEIIEPLFEAVNTLIEELITQPAKAEALYALIPETKREVAERKSKPVKAD